MNAERNEDLEKFLNEYEPPSIDNPPREEQADMFKPSETQTKEETEAEAPKTFGYELKLVLKPNVKGKSYTIPICAGVTYPNRIEYVLDRNFNGVKFRSIVRSIVGCVSSFTQQTNEPGGNEVSSVVDEIDWDALSDAFQEPAEPALKEPETVSEEF